MVFKIWKMHCSAYLTLHIYCCNILHTLHYIHTFTPVFLLNLLSPSFRQKSKQYFIIRIIRVIWFIRVIRTTLVIQIIPDVQIIQYPGFLTFGLYVTRLAKTCSVRKVLHTWEIIAFLILQTVVTSQHCCVSPFHNTDSPDYQGYPDFPSYPQ
jgi:hypothetical protein